MSKLPKYEDNLAKFVYELRKAIFNTQTEAGEYFYLSHSTIGRYEKDTADKKDGILPPTGYLACLAQLLGKELPPTEQQKLLNEVNESVRWGYPTNDAFYDAESTFADWSELCEKAVDYLAEQQHNHRTPKNSTAYLFLPGDSVSFSLPLFEPPSAVVRWALAQIDPTWQIVQTNFCQSYTNLLLGKAIKKAIQKNNKKQAVLLSLELGRQCLRYNNFQQAIDIYQRAIALTQQLDDGYNTARLQSNLSYAYTELATGSKSKDKAKKEYWQQAEHFGKQAFNIFKQQFDDADRLAHAANHLGILYARQKCPELAQPYFEQTRELWQNKSKEQLRVFINLGVLYFEVEQLPKAFEYIQESLRQARQTSDKIEMGKILLNLGVAYLHIHEHSQAELHMRQAESLFLEISSLIGLAKVWHNLHKIYLERKRLPEAHLYWQASQDIWQYWNKQYRQAKIETDLNNFEQFFAEIEEKLVESDNPSDILREVGLFA